MQRISAAGRRLATALAPVALTLLVSLAGAGPTTHASADGPILPPRTTAPADTSWGGCGGACSQQP